jgi:hypothetical protein
LLADALRSFPATDYKEIKKVTASERSRGTCSFTFGHSESAWAIASGFRFSIQRKLQIPRLRSG